MPNPTPNVIPTPFQTIFKASLPQTVSEGLYCFQKKERLSCLDFLWVPIYEIRKCFEKCTGSLPPLQSKGIPVSSGLRDAIQGCNMEFPFGKLSSKSSEKHNKEARESGSTAACCQLHLIRQNASIPLVVSLTTLVISDS